MKQELTECRNDCAVGNGEHKDIGRPAGTLKVIKYGNERRKEWTCDEKTLLVDTVYQLVKEHTESSVVENLDYEVDVERIEDGR